MASGNRAFLRHPRPTSKASLRPTAASRSRDCRGAWRQVWAIAGGRRYGASGGGQANAKAGGDCSKIPAPLPLGPEVKLGYFNNPELWVLPCGPHPPEPLHAYPDSRTRSVPHRSLFARGAAFLGSCKLARLSRPVQMVAKSLICHCKQFWSMVLMGQAAGLSTAYQLAASAKWALNLAGCGGAFSPPAPPRPPETDSRELSPFWVGAHRFFCAEATCPNPTTVRLPASRQPTSLAFFGPKRDPELGGSFLRTAIYGDLSRRIC